MSELRVEWDPAKARANLAKHGVAFEEAATVFWDECARLLEDSEHSTREDRFVLMGLSVRLRVLVVCHCYRESDEVIRLISARKATAAERREYARYRS